MSRLPRARRGTIYGHPNGWEPSSEADHFVQCPGRGAWIDMRDLGMVLEHAGPLPHPGRDKPQ